MATSDVDVVNTALVRLGDDLIDSFEDDSPRARAMNQLYPQVLDASIRMHNWNMFTRRATLQELSDTPLFGWEHMFQLPQDPFCLLVLTVNEEQAEQDADMKWEVESYVAGSASYRVLLTDESSVNLKYLARITDVTLWDALFAKAMSLQLAYEAASAITGKDSLMDRLGAELKEAWRMAKARDGQEGRPLRSVLSNSLTIVR